MSNISGDIKLTGTLLIIFTVYSMSIIKKYLILKIKNYYNTNNLLLNINISRDIKLARGFAA